MCISTKENLNPKVHSPPFAATVAATELYFLYQEDLVSQPLALCTKSLSLPPPPPPPTLLPPPLSVCIRGTVNVAKYS